MFTVQLHIPLVSTLGQHISFLQHLIGIAAVQAVREQPGYSELPINLKWPNDIYYGSNAKIGGVLVEASTYGAEVVVNAGECCLSVSHIIKKLNLLKFSNYRYLYICRF